MVFFIKKDFLLKLLKIAALVSAEKKIGANIWGAHILLQAINNKMVIIATDLDMELFIEAPLNTIHEEGSAVVPFRKIIEICRSMVEDVELKVFTNKETSKLHIESQQGFFSISFFLAEEFPQITSKNFYASFSVDTRTLRSLIGKTAFAMGEEDNRHFLNGLFFKANKDKIEAVATDGHRLAVWEAEDHLSLSSEIKFLLPRKSVFDLWKILNDFFVEAVSNVKIGENHFRIEVGAVTFTSKLLVAVFPAYQKLVPLKLKNQMIANKEQLKSCFLRAAALLGDKTQGARLLLSRNLLEISAQNEHKDFIKETLEVDYSGEPLEICFNIKYVLDFLSNLDSEEILLKIDHAKSGALFQDPKLNNTYMLMPMQL